MAGKPRSAVQGDLAIKYINKFPKTSSYRLGAMLFKEYPEVFSSQDVARTRVRYYRGSCGKDSREHQNGGKSTTVGPRVPKTDSKAWEPYKLPLIKAKWLIIADWHWPYHAPKVDKSILKYAKSAGCDRVLMLGDMADCHELSRWEKSPLERKFRSEFEVIKDGLDGICKYIKPKQIIWKAGNHEERFYKYLFRHAPALFGIEDFEWPELFDLEDRGIEWISDQRLILLDDLYLLHGHEFGNGRMSAIYPAAGIFKQAHASCVVAHCHRPDSHTEPAFTGKPITCWSIGCGCDLHPRYSRLNRWSHGFAIIEVSRGKRWVMSNYRVVDGKVIPA